MPKGTANYEIAALKCRDGVMNGSARFRQNVLADDVKNIHPYVYDGMHGFLITDKWGRWWVPETNVTDVRFKEDL